MITVRYKKGFGAFAKSYASPDPKTISASYAQEWNIEEARAFVAKNPDRFEIVMKRGAIEKVVK